METLWTESVSWINQNAVLVGGSCIIAFTAWFTVGRADDIWRGMMHRKARRDYVKVLATDDFVDRIEQRVMDGEFTREEATELYVALKRCFPIRDLFPATRWLKENIRRRLNGEAHKPVPLPDRTPVKKRRHMFSEAE